MHFGKLVNRSCSVEYDSKINESGHAKETFEYASDPKQTTLEGLRAYKGVSVKLII